MEKENFVTLMDQIIKEIFRMVNLMEKGNIVLLMDQLIKEIF
jgi:hypothetical protein